MQKVEYEMHDTNNFSLLKVIQYLNERIISNVKSDILFYDNRLRNIVQP